MPSKKINGNPEEIMKAISMFDIENDFDNTEAKEKLDILFHNLIVSSDPKAKEFLEKFLSQSTKVIADMGIINEPEEDDTDDVVDFEDEPVDDESPIDDEPVDGDEVDDEVPDNLLGAGYNPLIARANSFLNY